MDLIFSYQILVAGGVYIYNQLVSMNRTYIYLYNSNSKLAIALTYYYNGNLVYISTLYSMGNSMVLVS